MCATDMSPENDQKTEPAVFVEPYPDGSRPRALKCARYGVAATRRTILLANAVNACQLRSGALESHGLHGSGALESHGLHGRKWFLMIKILIEELRCDVQTAIMFITLYYLGERLKLEGEMVDPRSEMAGIDVYSVQKYPFWRKRKWACS